MKRTLNAITLAAACAVSFQANAAILFSDNFDAEAESYSQTTLTNWSISNGTIDVIGVGTPYDLQPGNGRYIDLDGSTNDAGRMTSSAISLLAGTTYDLVFSLAGSQRGDSNSVDYGIDTDNNGTIDFTGTQTLASGASFASFNLSFTALASSGNARIVFDHAGSDNVGLLLDNVQLRSRDIPGVPEPATLMLLGLGLAGLGYSRRKS